jgi:hypothetical protein
VYGAVLYPDDAVSFFNLSLTKSHLNLSIPISVPGTDLFDLTSPSLLLTSHKAATEDGAAGGGC